MALMWNAVNETPAPENSAPCPYCEGTGRVEYPCVCCGRRDAKYVPFLKMFVCDKCIRPGCIAVNDPVALASLQK